MSIKVLKIIAVVLMLAGSFCSCAKKGNNTDDVCEDCLCIFNVVGDKSSSILGKWKLIKGWQPFVSLSDCYDYSQYNIVFEFKIDNVLMVSAETENPRVYPSTGEHFYSIDEYVYDGTSGFRMKINTLYWAYGNNHKELIISDLPLDGPIYYFVKIE